MVRSIDVNEWTVNKKKKALITLETNFKSLVSKNEMLEKKQSENNKLLDELRKLLKIHIADKEFFESKIILQADLKFCLKIIEESLLPY